MRFIWSLAVVVVATVPSTDAQVGGGGAETGPRMSDQRD